MILEKIAQIKAQAEAATEGPWHNGSETSVGYVWVYASSSPLVEPVGLNGWFAKKCRNLKIAAMGKLRGDSLFQRMHEPSEMYKGRVWRQKQKDAAFISASRQNVPMLCDIIEELLGLVTVKDKGFLKIKTNLYGSDIESALSRISAIMGEE